MAGKAGELVAVLGAVDPDAYAVAGGAKTSSWISAAHFDQFMAVVLCGDLGSGAALDAKMEQATSAAGAGAKDISGAVITQLTQSGTDDSNKQAVISISQDSLDYKNGFEYFRLSMTVGTATSDFGGVILGINGRFAPPTAIDATTVDEIV